MKIRLATEQDRVGVYKTIGYCFNMSQDTIENNIKNGPLNKYEQFIVAINDNNEMESVFSVVPFNVNFEGEVCKFGGVAGVSSLPEHRGTGNIEAIFKYALNYMKENNMALSGLGPFAFPFYRNYGYEWAYTWQMVNFNINDLKGFKAAPKYKELTRDDKELFESFRNEFCKKINGPIIRDERIINEKWDSYRAMNARVYGAYNEFDELVSMMVYYKEGSKQKVSEMYFKDEISRQYLLNFLYRHRSNSDSVELTLTTDDEIRNILPSPRIQYWHWPNKMGRVVMVKEALEMMKLHEDIDGEFNILVHDKYAPWNEKTFKVKIKDHKVNVSETTDSSDFEININRLSQIILGHLSGKEAIKLNFVNVTNQDKVDLFNKFFTKRTTMIWQEF